MNVEDYEDLPDGMSLDEVERIFGLWYEASKNENLDTSLNKLNILGDKQWHTYDFPSDDVRDRLTVWLSEKIIDEESMLEDALGACYSFALSKKLFESYFSRYNGEHKDEFQIYLGRSAGDFIDPYQPFRDK